MELREAQKIINFKLLFFNSKIMRFIIILFSCLLSLGIQVRAQSKTSEMKIHQENPDSVMILWIGNSFTFYNDVPKMVEDMALLNNIPVSTKRILKGGESFKGHLQNPELSAVLEKGGLDYVVMQEFSSTPAYSTKFVAENIFPYATEIDSLAKKYSPGVETIYYMTWGHKNGNVRQTDYPLDDTYELMQDRIINTYIDLAYENGGTVAPVGIAWRNVREKYPEIELYIEDNFHPSLEGSYLAALTLLGTIVKGEFIPIPPDGLDETTAGILYQEAMKAIK